MLLDGESEKILLDSGIIQSALKKDASDIHLCPGNPPTARIHGKVVPLSDMVLTGEDVDKIVRLLTNRFMLSDFFGENPRDLDYTVEMPSTGRRFRINVFKQYHGSSIVMRVLSNRLRSLEELGLPKKLEELALERSGLVLVTGATGSGKSTTLAAMIEIINQRSEKHIITIEDPIEIVFQNKRSLIEQREIGTHVPDFHIALRSALRETPDVILVGEIRDEETAQMTLRSAQVGALVIATLHTRSAQETISRFLSLFSDDHRGGARLQVSDCLLAVVCQNLILTKNKEGRVAACELLLGTTAIRHLIRQDRMHLLHSAMEIASEHGMITMEQSLVNHGNNGIISWEDAFSFCNEKEAFLAQMPPGLRRQFTIDWEMELDIKKLEALKESRLRIAGSDVYVKKEGGDEEMF
ncbi:MAG: PilT/PilU family type 4a pilus ATPase [Candidatus Eremiobacteraeota bacterium]|nr:PilT/PilU family type 4a pilus ATPase [Candidatus Eremiobacteraeota bacterium]